MRRLRHLLLHPLLPTALSCPPRADPYLMPLAQLRCHRLVRPLLRNRPRFLTQTIFIRHAVLRLIFPLFSRCALCTMLQRGTRPIRRNQTLHIEDVPRTSRTGQLARLAGSALRGPGRREHLCGVEVLARKSHLLLKFRVIVGRLKLRRVRLHVLRALPARLQELRGWLVVARLGLRQPVGKWRRGRLRHIPERFLVVCGECLPLR